MESSSSKLVLMLISILSLLIRFSNSSTLVVDGVTKWTHPIVYTGDTIIFKHKYGYKLYIFQNREAFKLCNFTLATPLTMPNSTSFTWHPSRPGFFYFSFNNGSTKPCQVGQKLTIKVSTSPPPPLENTATSPQLSPLVSPGPISAGSVSSSPAYPWPFQPRESVSPSPSQTEFLPMGPTSAQGPFINSNPVEPFPAGEGDAATIRPLPISDGQVVEVLAAQMASFCFVTFVMMML